MRIIKLKAISQHGIVCIHKHSDCFKLLGGASMHNGRNYIHVKSLNSAWSYWLELSVDVTIIAEGTRK